MSPYLALFFCNRIFMRLYRKVVTASQPFGTFGLSPLKLNVLIVDFELGIKCVSLAELGVAVCFYPFALLHMTIVFVTAEVNFVIFEFFQLCTICSICIVIIIPDLLVTVGTSLSNSSVKHLALVIEEICLSLYVGLLTSCCFTAGFEIIPLLFSGIIIVRSC